MKDLIPPTPTTARAVADIIWPTVETMRGELPPAGAGFFVGRCSTPGSLDRQQWHADREAAIADAETTPDQPTYLALGLHTVAATCSADTFVALAAVAADSDVAVTGPDGKIRHADGAINGDGAEARIAQSSMPPAALIIRTSDSDGRQAFWPLDRYTDCDDGADILAAMRVRASKAQLDTAVYNLSQWVRAGGPGCRTIHTNPRRAAVTVIADDLITEHETAVSVASKPPKASTGKRTPGVWLGKHPQIVVDVLRGAGWTGPVGKARRLSNGGTRYLFRHPTASHAKSAMLVIHDDGLWFRSWSDNTDAGHGRDEKGQDGIGALATLLNVDISGAAGWLRTNHPECATWCSEAPEPAGDVEPGDEGSGPDGHRFTDTGNAQRLVDLSDGCIRYVHAWSKWICFGDGRWIVDTGDVIIQQYAKRVAASLFRQMTAATGGQRDATYKWAKRSEAAGSILAMVKLARGAEGVLVAHDALDADPYLLNVLNGTIDLRTGTLNEHDPADLITMQAPVTFDPQAEAALWGAALDRWQPDPAIRRYLQTEAGAGATGLPTETLSVHYGSGGNGKSKFWGAIQNVLGEYTMVPDKSLLIKQKYEPHPTVKAALFRKRLAVSSESETGGVFHEEQVKALTGGDRIEGRRMREDPWSFTPSHTIVLFSNHKPVTQGQDNGVWRRLRLVPWEVTIPGDEVDERFADKLAAEAPGILNWIVAGARMFIADGIAPPAVIRDATNLYRADQNRVQRFIDEALLIGDSWARASALRSELEVWNADTGCLPVTMEQLTAALQQLGCTRSRKTVPGGQTTVWAGVSILDALATYGS